MRQFRPRPRQPTVFTRFLGFQTTETTPGMPRKLSFRRNESGRLLENISRGERTGLPAAKPMTRVGSVHPSAAFGRPASCLLSAGGAVDVETSCAVRNTSTVSLQEVRPETYPAGGPPGVGLGVRQSGSAVRRDEHVVGLVAVEQWPPIPEGIGGRRGFRTSKKLCRNWVRPRSMYRGERGPKDRALSGRTLM